VSVCCYNQKQSGDNFLLTNAGAHMLAQGSQQTYVVHL
jgi:hypothetical protein